MLCAAAAIVCANVGALHGFYAGLLHFEAGISAGGAEIAGDFHFWVNDGLMAIFFLLVGLEIKRELMSGELSTVRLALLPAIAAVGGMVVPAAIYVGFNAGDSESLRGWAVPTATDIAFSLAVLALLGTRVPLAMKVFLTAVAVIDDLLAIIIIALFYATELQPWYLALAAAIVSLMLVLNRAGIQRLTPYLVLGLVLWVAMANSGVHATLAGVVAAGCIPHRRAPQPDPTPLLRLEHSLHWPVTYMIMPLFAFVNAGVEFGELAASDLASALPLGIALGLVVGKPLGICGAVWIAVALRVGSFPRSLDWPRLAGIACLCGIGFTVSLFIGNLAFGNLSDQLVNLTKLGVLAGSCLSGLAGYFVLRSLLRG